MSMRVRVNGRLRRFAFAALCAVLSACSGTPRPKPADITDAPSAQNARVQWTSQIGAVNFPLVVSVQQNRVALADSQGTVAVLDSATGQDIWRTQLNEAIAAGVGSDGTQVALVTRNNELVVLQQGQQGDHKQGQVKWRKRLPAQVFTAPLVAGARVFVLTAERTVMAFDGQTGQALWSLPRPGEPLVLKQASVLQAFQNTLLVGLSGRLVALNPDSGAVLWESAVATPRGINDIERLVDLLAPADRQGDVVCVRAFQTALGCVNAVRGQSLWTRLSAGEVGVSGNAQVLIAPLSNGVVQAWSRSSGERLWESDRLKYRALSAPLVHGDEVLLADGGGWLYGLSLRDGALLRRVQLGDAALAAAPVLAAQRLLLVNAQGRVSALDVSK